MTKKNEIIILALVTALFVVIQIQNALVNGKLIVPLTPDDVWYFLDGLKRLYNLYDGTFAVEYAKDLPHAPLATYLCMIAFMLFGPVIWGPSIIYGIFTFGVIIYIRYLCREMNNIFKYTIYLMVFGWPIITHSFLELRPDIICGFLTVATIFLILEDFEWINNIKKSILIGFFFGLALIAKPSISPLTLTSIMLAMFLSTSYQYYLYCTNKSNNTLVYRIYLERIILIMLITFSISIPYYYHGLAIILKYIYAGLVEEEKVWDLHLSLYKNSTYYLWGNGGAFMMGTIWTRLVYVVYFSALIKLIRTKNLKANLFPIISYLIIFLYIYLAASIPLAKQPFLGCSISWFLLLALIKCLTYLLKDVIFTAKEKFNYTLILIPLFMIIGVITINWSFPQQTYGKIHDYKTIADPLFEKERLNFSIDKLLEYRGHQKVNKENNNPIKLFIAGADPIFNSDNISIELYKKVPLWGDRALDFEANGKNIINDFTVIKNEIDTADVIFAFSLDDPKIPKYNSIDPFKKEMLSYICHSRKFDLKYILNRDLTPGSTYYFFKFKTGQPKIFSDNFHKVCGI